MSSKILDYSALQIEKLKTSEGRFNFLNLSIPVLMGIFIFLNPFTHTTAIKEICFYLSLFIVLLLICFKKIDFSFKSPLTLPFALFTLWVFIGLFFALYKENSIHDFYAHLLKYLAIYYILINFFNSRKRLIVLSWIIIISVAIFSIGGTIYFYLILGNDILVRILFKDMSMNTVGFFAIPSILLSLHILARERKFYIKLILLISLVGTSFVTILTQSRGTLLAMIFSLFILFPKNKKVLIVFFLCLAIAVGFMPTPIKNRITPVVTFDVPALKNDGRMKIWCTYIEIIKDYPFSGTGFGMELWQHQDLWDKYSSRVSPEWRIHMFDPHNMLVSTTARLGLVGLALFLYITFTFVRMSWVTIKHGKDDFIKSWGLCITATFIAFFIQGMFEEATSHVPAIVLYSIFAMMTILWKIDSETSSRTSQNLISHR